MSWVRSGATPLSDLLPSENDVMSYGLKIADLGIFFLFLKKIQTFLFLVFFFLSRQQGQVERMVLEIDVTLKCRSVSYITLANLLDFSRSL